MDPVQPTPTPPPDQAQPLFPSQPQAPVDGVFTPTVNQGVVNPSPVPSVNSIGIDTSGLFQSPAPVLGTPLQPGSPPSSTRRSRRKLMLILVPMLVVIFGASTAAYFGYYVPNKPENLWQTALTNTGKGYDKLSEYVTKTKTAKDFAIDGNFKSTGIFAADGTIKGSSNGDSGQITGSLSASGVKIDFDVRALSSGSGKTPDIYFKVDGLQGLGTLFGGGDPTISKALEGLNGQWYFVDHTLFDQYAAGANSNLQITSKDISSILKAVGDASKQYIFTKDSSKAAVTLKQSVGKETQDGRSVYHYKVGLNKVNLKAYNKALCDALLKTKLSGLLSSSSGADSASDCYSTTDIDSIDYSRTADAWVDTQTKLIHKIRISEKNKSDNYFEIGQNYTGGDEFPFSIGFHGKDNGNASSENVQLVLNMKTDSIMISGDASSGGPDAFGGNFKLSITPSSSLVKVEKPTGAKTFIELLNDIGFGDIVGGTQTQARDTERKTDINALQGQIEAYNAQNGTYPTLAQLNDPSFRAANMKGLDSAALQDPQGTDQKVVDLPKANAYSYSPTPAGCDNGANGDCTGYTLTATLEAGGTYVKQDLNGPTSI